MAPEAGARERGMRGPWPPFSSGFVVVCWPLALLTLVLYPVVWFSLPFRILGAED